METCGVRAMETWIAFIKSVNVGGRNILPMADLRSVGAKLGYKNFGTYIQSGNCVFQTTATGPEIERDLANAIEAQFGFAVPVLALTQNTLDAAIAANPYEAEPNKLHLHFVWEVATPDLARVEALATKSEQFRLIGKVLYLHAPDGVGRSKLFARLPKVLGAVTVRNLKTVVKVRDLARSL